MTGNNSDQSDIRGYIVNADPLTFEKFEHPCFPETQEFPKIHSTFIKWSNQIRFCIYSTSNSSDVGLVANINNVWGNLYLDEIYSATLPLSKDKSKNAKTVGFYIDFSNYTSVILAPGESDIPPGPILYLLTDDGDLLLFQCVYVNGDPCSLMIAPKSTTSPINSNPPLTFGGTLPVSGTSPVIDNSKVAATGFNFNVKPSVALSGDSAVAKKTESSGFSFNVKPTSATHSDSTTVKAGFSFGANPADSSIGVATKTPTAGFSFGAKPADSSVVTPKTQTAGFSFGAKPADSSIGVATKTPTAGFSFGVKPVDSSIGVATKTPTAGFSFGAKPADSSVVTPKTQTAGFSFGAKPADSSVSNTATTKLETSFSFGAKPSSSNTVAAPAGISQKAPTQSSSTPASKSNPVAATPASESKPSSKQQSVSKSNSSTPSRGRQVLVDKFNESYNLFEKDMKIVFLF